MAIKLYWCRGKGRNDPSKQNFGDYLSPLLVEMVSGKAVQYASAKKADMIALGTILGREKKAKRFFIPRCVHIWGSGASAPSDHFSGRHFYHAVRGQKTKERVVGLRTEPALGDPGILANLWWGERSKPNKKYRIGVIPHYVDQQSKAVNCLATIPGLKIIDVFSPVEEVLKNIQECHYIFSSSMHGLIVADAFGVPNKRVIFSKGLISDFKFIDYYSSFNLDEPESLAPQMIIDRHAEVEGLIGEYSRPGLPKIQEDLLKAFPLL